MDDKKSGQAGCLELGLFGLVIVVGVYALFHLAVLEPKRKHELEKLRIQNGVSKLERQVFEEDVGFGKGKEKFYLVPGEKDELPQRAYLEINGVSVGEYLESLREERKWLLLGLLVCFDLWEWNV